MTLVLVGSCDFVDRPCFPGQSSDPETRYPLKSTLEAKLSRGNEDNCNLIFVHQLEALVQSQELG
jgi:hypothetical protein